MQTTDSPRRSLGTAKAKIASVVAAGAVVTAGLMGNHAVAADLVGTVTPYAAEAAGVTFAGEATVWQGQVLANKSALPWGYTSYNSGTGVSSVSGVTPGIQVKTSAVFGSLLANIDNVGQLRTTDAGGNSTLVLPALGAAADWSMVAEGANLWISKDNTLNRYTPVGAVLGAATPIGTYPLGATVRVAMGPDGNMWVTQKNGAGGADMVMRVNVTTAAIVGSALSLPSSPAADPIAIAKGPDASVWILEGNNSVARVDTGTLGITEFALPAGTSPSAIALGPDSGMWITENSANNVARLAVVSNALTRTAYPAPLAAGLKGLTVGPDGNIWAVGTSQIVKFGTNPPTTTTTTTTTPPTTVVVTTAAPTTVAPTTAAPTTVAPTTVAPTTVPPTTAAPTTLPPPPPTTLAPPVAEPYGTPKGKHCTQTRAKFVKVGKRKVLLQVCTRSVRL